MIAHRYTQHKCRTKNANFSQELPCFPLPITHSRFPLNDSVMFLLSFVSILNKFCKYNVTEIMIEFF